MPPLFTLCGLLAGVYGHLWSAALALAVGLVGGQRHGVLALLFCLGCLRGVSLSDAGPPSFPRAGELIEFEVADSVSPRRPCRVPVVVAPGHAGLDLVLESGSCSWHRGQRIVVSREGPAVEVQGRRWRLRRDRALLRRDAEGGPLRWWRAAVAQRRERAMEFVQGRPAAGLGASVALGLKRALAPEVRAQLRLAGLGHLLAVSGLHVGLVAWLLLRLGGALAGRRMRGLKLAWGLAGVMVAAYVAATGASPSSLRAGFVFALVGLASLSGRPVHRLHLLATAATGLLLMWPGLIHELGFGFSLLAVFALLGARSVLQMQWRLAWGLAGLNLYCFGYIPWIGALVNLVAVPLFAAAVLPFALVGWAIGGSWGATICAWAEPGSVLLLDLASTAARVQPWGRIEATVALGFGCVLWGVSRMLARPPVVPGWSLLALALALGVGSWAQPEPPGCSLPSRWSTASLNAEAAYRWRARPLAERAALIAEYPRVANEGLLGQPACGRSPWP